MSETPANPADAIAHNRSGLLICLMLSVSLHTIDATIVNVALPQMRGTLQATFDQISWVVTTYIIAAVVLTPLVGWAANRFGVKRLLILSISTFTLASVLCGLALTLEAMLAARILQGAAGAPLIPLAIATMNRLSTDAADRARLMALFGLGTMAGPVLGPSLGGYITDVSSWRWVFFINLPVGIIALAGLGMTMKKGMHFPGHKLNGIGFLSLALAIGTLQLALDRGETEDWFESVEIIAYGLIFICSAWVFTVNSRTSANAFLPGALFRDRNYMVGMILILITAGSMTASVVLQPPMMQNLMGYPVLETGVILMWRGVGMMAGMMLTPRLTRIFSTRTLLIIGGAAMACGIYPFIFLTSQSPETLLSLPPILHGFGIGILFVVASTVAYASISHEMQVEASSVFSLVRGLGQAVSISIVVALVSRYSQVNHAELVERLSPLRPYTPETLRLSGGADAARQFAMNELMIQREAAMMAYNNAYLALFCAAIVVIFAAFLIKIPKTGVEPSPDHPVEA